MGFYIGCAVWAYKHWVGNFYPSKSRASDFLSLYSQRLTTVEGNTTFYSVPNAETVKRWADETPSAFKFCLKFPRSVTHQGMLMPQLKEAIAFINHMQPLGSRLGPIFAQLPPSYHPHSLDDLITFLDSLPHHDLPFAVEVRHADWFESPHAETLNQELSKLGIGRVLLDSRPIYECPDDPQVASERKKPQVPLQRVTTGNFSLVRFISHPDLEFNHLYLQDWVTPIHQWLKERTDIYFFVHCPDEGRSPHIARQFHRMLEQNNVPVSPLPWNGVEPPPAQLSLF
ncbi:MAG: DUF72 domain-containing protein [Elainellaceae cyanobacterium]